MERGVTRTTRRQCGAGRRMKRFSIGMTGGFAVRIRSRDIRRSARGRGDWRGRFLGFAEELEFLRIAIAGKAAGCVMELLEKAAKATADFYLDQATAADGIPYWDTAAPNLHRLGDWRTRNAEPFNEYEPVDSSAAAIAAQGLLRLGRYLGRSRIALFRGRS